MHDQDKGRVICNSTVKMGILDINRNVFGTGVSQTPNKLVAVILFRTKTYSNCKISLYNAVNDIEAFAE